MNLVRRLRTSICDTFEEVGPLAPTLCEGWLAQDLAAHLWIREHRHSALPGIGIKRFADHTRRVQSEALHTLGFDKLVQDLRRPAGLMGLLGPVAVSEFTIHHTDLSRANGLHLELTDADERRLWPSAAMLARKAARNFGGRVIITPSTGRSLSVGNGPRPVHVSGPPSEIAYFAAGRTAHADVEITAEPETREQFLASVGSL